MSCVGRASRSLGHRGNAAWKQVVMSLLKDSRTWLQGDRCLRSHLFFLTCWVFVHHVDTGACRRQKRVTDGLKLESQAVVNGSVRLLAANPSLSRRVERTLLSHLLQPWGRWFEGDRAIEGNSEVQGRPQPNLRPREMWNSGENRSSGGKDDGGGRALHGV